MYIVLINYQHQKEFVHLATSEKKAIEWVQSHGQDWHEEDYTFVIASVVPDKDRWIEEYNEMVIVNPTGDILSRRTQQAENAM